MPWQTEPKKDVATLRKAPGSRLQADPEISEWGNPLTVMGEDFSKEGASEGTETSQYLEEKRLFP